MKDPQSEGHTPWTTRRVAWLIAFGVLLYAALMNPGVLGQAARWLFLLLTPILMGLVFALILNVPMHGFELLLSKIDKKNKLRTGTRQKLALLLAVLVVPLVLVVLISFIVPQFVEAVTNVVRAVQQNEDVLVNFLSRLGLSRELVTEKLHDVGGWLNENIGHIAGATISTAMGVVGTVADVAMGLVLAIYMLADKAALQRRVTRVVRALLPKRASKVVIRVSSMFSSTFRTFFSRQCLEAVILGTLVCVVSLILRIPYAVTLGCMTAVFALIPYIGAFLSLVLGAILVATVSPIKALIYAVAELAAQQIEGNLIYPRVVGKSVGLPAYVTLFAIMIGGSLAGIFGIFLVIPVASVIYTLLREFVHRRLDRAQETPAPEAETGET